MFPLKYSKVYETPEDYKPPEPNNLHNNVTYPNMNCIDYAARPENYTVQMHDNWDAITKNDDGHLVVVTNKRFGSEWWGTLFGFHQIETLKQEKSKFEYHGQELITKVKYVTSNILLVGFVDGRLEAWSILSENSNSKMFSLNKIDSQTGHLDAINQLSIFKADTNKAVTACLDRKLTVWDLSCADLSPTNHYRCAHNSDISGVDTAHDTDKLFVTCARDGVVKLWDLREVRPATRLYENTSLVFSAIMWAESTPSSSNNMIYLGDFNGNVHTLDYRSPNKFIRSDVYFKDSNVSQIIQNGKYLSVIGNQPAAVRVAYLNNHSSVYEYQAARNEEFINDALWHDEQTLLTVGQKRKFNLHKIIKS